MWFQDSGVRSEATVDGHVLVNLQIALRFDTTKHTHTL